MRPFNDIEYAWLFFVALATPWKQPPTAAKMTLLLIASLIVHAVDQVPILLAMVMFSAIVLAVVWRIQEWPVAVQSAKLSLLIQFFSVMALGLMASGVCVAMVSMVPSYPPILWTLWGIFTHTLLCLAMLGNVRELPSDYWLSAAVWCATEALSLLPMFRPLELWLLIWIVSFLAWLFWNECCCNCFKRATQMRATQQQQAYQRAATTDGALPEDNAHFEIESSRS